MICVYHKPYSYCSYVHQLSYRLGAPHLEHVAYSVWVLYRLYALAWWTRRGLGCPGAAMGRARWSSDCVAAGPTIPCCSHQPGHTCSHVHWMLGKCQISYFKILQTHVMVDSDVWFASDDFEETTNEFIYSRWNISSFEVVTGSQE